jgi:hypothetical protein
MCHPNPLCSHKCPDHDRMTAVIPLLIRVRNTVFDMAHFRLVDGLHFDHSNTVNRFYYSTRRSSGQFF